MGKWILDMQTLKASIYSKYHCLCLINEENEM